MNLNISNFLDLIWVTFAILVTRCDGARGGLPCDSIDTLTSPATPLTRMLGSFTRVFANASTDEKCRLGTYLQCAGRAPGQQDPPCGNKQADVEEACLPGGGGQLRFSRLAIWSGDEGEGLAFFAHFFSRPQRIPPMVMGGEGGGGGSFRVQSPGEHMLKPGLHSCVGTGDPEMPSWSESSG